jgi:hypothetical protein
MTSNYEALYALTPKFNAQVLQAGPGKDFRGDLQPRKLTFGDTTLDIGRGSERFWAVIENEKLGTKISFCGDMFEAGGPRAAWISCSSDTTKPENVEAMIDEITRNFNSSAPKPAALAR